MERSSIQQQFGGIDIYLFDQILRGNIRAGMRIVDAGCGGGRNLVYFLNEGYEVFAADASRNAIAEVQRMAGALAPALPSENFRVEQVESMSFPDAFADVVISNSVLHLARDDAQFRAMLLGSWRVLKPGGLWFCRLASVIGMESTIGAPDGFIPLGGRRFTMPDGSDRYVVDEALLMQLTAELGGELVDRLKTTVVQNLRCMTTWVMWKR